MNLEQMNPDPLITFHCDGRVTVSDKLKPEETAKLVLDQVKTQWMDDIQCAKIRELEDRIKRLEEVGERLWVKARNISIEDTYDRHGNEVAVQELNPETVVLDYDHGDGITAGNMVELLEALKEWKKAKEAKP